ncbi:MAG TPA: hypothetical protein VHS31_13975 [Tepidisphaeraceae bacterium]|jgi:hypothetical protein|nr:hypothetical protein [Tepidisphaeraceae bacterium]
MQAREIEESAKASSPPDLIFSTSPNWTSVVFFAGLGLLHLFLATLAFWQGRWEGYMSAGLGTIFVVVSIVSYRCRFEITIQSRRRQIRLRSGFGKFWHQRFIPFTHVHGVRLTLGHLPDDPASRIEVLCENEDIECPPTSIPRQEALCLAMLMGVRLIKVYEDDGAERSDRIESLNH